MDDYANKNDDEMDGRDLEVVLTSEGSLGILCSTMHGFTIDDHHYLFCHNSDQRFFIQELVDGVLGEIKQPLTGMEDYYRIAFHFAVGGANYLFVWSDDNSGGNERIYAISSDITIDVANPTYEYDREHTYHEQFPFIANNGNTYYFSQDTQHHVFVRQLLPGGSVGDDIFSDTWANEYQIHLPFKVGDTVYTYGQDVTGYWFVEQMEGNGAAPSDGAEVANAKTFSDHDYYDLQFTLVVGGISYLYGKRTSDQSIFIRQFTNANGQFVKDDHTLGAYVYQDAQSSVGGSIGTSFPTSGAFAYYILQGDALSYKVFSLGDASGYKYGPYAYL